MAMSPSAGVAARHTPHTMNHELLRAAATGDKALLERVLGLRSSSNGVVWHLRQEDTQKGGSSRSCLKGVTSEGNTALHTAAERGYLEHVRIMCGLDASLIKSRNNLRNTPLICAARAGHVDVVCFLIEHDASAVLESGCVDEEPMLRARNSEGATAMHEAIRNGHEAVLQKLVSADGALAAAVDAKGFSPLYLAAALGRADMVNVLIGGSPDGVKSPAYYAGPDGQTALHAAVLVSEGKTAFCSISYILDVVHDSCVVTGFQEMSKSLWRWEPTLAKKVDNFGNTALHHAASAGKIGAVKLLLLEDSSLAYIPDVDGLFPVHTAAKMGKMDVIEQLMETCPNCDDLLDNKGRNVLHCAIEHKKEKAVQHMCKNPRFGRMMNARDSRGNTPLHLAVKHGCDRIVILLVKDVKVNLSTMNNDGETPLDVAINEVDHGYTYPMNPEVLIAQCLVWCGAHRSPRRRDEYLNKRRGVRGSEKELSKYTNLTQNRAIGSVLIATVTFAAPFTLPGSAADAAERPAFRSFILSNALAFLCSTVATCLLMYAGLNTVHPRYRSRYHVWSSNLLHVGVLLVIATFAFGVHLTLSPPGTGAPVPVGNLNAAVCAMACVSVVFTHPGTWWPMVLARPIWARLGLKGLSSVLLGPRPIPCQKLLLSRTPWLNLFKMLATLLILASILATFLWDMAYLLPPPHHRFSSTLLQQPQCQSYSHPT
ncbi:ankyrin repeat-containing protein At5g02620-like [Phragmites australis]|uniref:ankyrin repeat-containing protein At5g02620-like n=1 Tax=Phragmites australis TaxID=29695 RepID=UPI002D79E1A5|nr:ankyrin repeat-containing protein At5g02620-like [Phragmites australis]